MLLSLHFGVVHQHGEETGRTTVKWKQGTHCKSSKAGGESYFCPLMVGRIGRMKPARHGSLGILTMTLLRSCRCLAIEAKSLVSLSSGCEL